MFEFHIQHLSIKQDVFRLIRQFSLHSPPFASHARLHQQHTKQRHLPPQNQIKPNDSIPNHKMTIIINVIKIIKKEAYRLMLSLVRVVFRLLHIWHVTYSPMYFLRRLSMYLGTNRPRITRRLLPSMEPSVPSSAIMNWYTWSGERRIFEQIS